MHELTAGIQQAVDNQAGSTVAGSAVVIVLALIIVPVVALLLGPKIIVGVCQARAYRRARLPAPEVDRLLARARKLALEELGTQGMRLRRAVVNFGAGAFLGALLWSTCMVLRYVGSVDSGNDLLPSWVSTVVAAAPRWLAFAGVVIGALGVLYALWLEPVILELRRLWYVAGTTSDERAAAAGRRGHC